ncbi:MAG TPA: hypothetical protein VKN99_17325 [Polyangia bacterium]|nr:hypothetical protein [Polyangia bacterium]
MRGAIVLAGLAACGCSNPKGVGPVLRPGPWHALIRDDSSHSIGSALFLADSAGKLDLTIQGQLPDGTGFQISGQPSMLYEGSNFTILGTVSGRALSGYGRARVFDTLLTVLIPFDNLPDHALLVGAIAWQFNINAGTNDSHVEGTWGAASMGAGALGGSFVADPGPLPADALIDAATDSATDAPIDATTD